MRAAAQLLLSKVFLLLLIESHKKAIVLAGENDRFWVYSKCSLPLPAATSVRHISFPPHS